MYSANEMQALPELKHVRHAFVVLCYTELSCASASVHSFFFSVVARAQFRIVSKHQYAASATVVDQRAFVQNGSTNYNREKLGDSNNFRLYSSSPPLVPFREKLFCMHITHKRTINK